MKRIMLAVALAAAAGSAMADVGVSINVGQPGFYGQIDIGNVPAPQVVYAQPVVVQQDPVYVSQPPIYLRVRPGYEKHWNRHCREYNACGRQVYFVRGDWYNNVYVPTYQQHHEEWHDHDRGEHRGWDHGDGGDRHGDGGDRGEHGHGHGHGHDD